MVETIHPEPPPSERAEPDPEASRLRCQWERACAWADVARIPILDIEVLRHMTRMEGMNRG